jgi:hypothetical protein
MWKASEQLEAKNRDAWGVSSSTETPSSFLCNINCGFVGTTVACDYKGFFFCCGPSTTKWFLPPNCTEIRRTWYQRTDAVTVANSCMGSCGWFFPDCSQLSSWFNCRGYVDGSVFGSPYYTSDTECAPDRSWALSWHGGGFYSPAQFGNFKNNSFVMRGMRCVT